LHSKKRLLTFAGHFNTIGDMIFVLDASTILAATQGQPAAHALLRAVRAQTCDAAASLPLLLQWQSALLAAVPPRGSAAQGGAATRAFAGALAALCQPVQLNPLWRPQCRDPVDDLLLATAHAARATHIVLLRGAARLSTRAQVLGIALVTPAQALQILDGTAVDSTTPPLG
jgi:predicted nucleic acid-binding protein